MEELYVLDASGNYAATINGIPQQGPLVGWSGLQYNPSGAALDKIPSYSVKLPLTAWQNIAATAGTQLMVWETDIQDEMTRGVVLDTVQSVDANGVLWATVTFVDVLRDLVRADVTSGFATSPGESMYTTLLRLTQLADTTWGVINDVTGFDGVTFTAYRQSVAQAIGKLATERFVHFRREYQGDFPRFLHMGSFGGYFTVNGSPLWFSNVALSPSDASSDLSQRQMNNVQFSRKGTVTNSLTPYGGGNGPSQMTLRTLYGNTTFQGYNALHPIRQRIPQDGGVSTFDGFDYYIDDAASIAAYGRSWGSLSKNDINPVASPAGQVAAADEQTAAISLYVVADASMKWSVTPTFEMTFETDAVGDLRNIAGMKVHVTYQDYAFDAANNVYAMVDTEVESGGTGDFTVLEVVRTRNDDGSGKDKWTVSNNAQYATEASGVLIGQMDQITALGASITTYPHRYTIPKSGPIDTSYPLRLRIRPDNSVVRHHYALLSIDFNPIRNTYSDTGHAHDVATASMNHDLASGNTHDINALSNVKYRVGGNPLVDGAVDYDPSTQFHISPTPPGSAVAVMYDPVGQFFYYSGTNHGVQDVPLASSHLGIVQINPTSGGTGGKVVATSGAANKAGQIGGTVPATTHLASAGVGAKSTKAIGQSVSEGPLPTNVSIWIDGRQEIGGVVNGGTYDLMPWVDDQAGHLVEIHGTVGEIDCQLDISVDITTTALTPQGTT